MAKTWPDKDPDEVLEYGFDWSPRGLGIDTIITTTALVVTGDVVVNSHAVVDQAGIQAGQSTTTWLSGGTDNTNCTILLRAITTLGRKLDQTISIHIASR